MAVEGPCRVAEGEGPAKKKQRKNESISLGRTEAGWGKRYLVASVSSYVFFGTALNETSKKSSYKKNTLAPERSKFYILCVTAWEGSNLRDLQVSLSIAVSSNHPIVCASEVFFMLPTLLLLAAKSSGS